ncbi:response regulator [Bradyrhizobium brasilense]|uniref:response regulator n=1 Tax=Bradyrhizobium brasilense TaxID=1419277 RepID=UPI0024B04495|nr:response regulator [Bradyrhizobium australafricanum]WFU32865.1 response regulator [Bradyrhizobium australafricanum]
MTALAQSIARAFPTNSLRSSIARHVLLLASAVLFVAALRASYGLDLSVGLF